jgi:phosphoribosyl-AMP cyclohydrolase
VTQVLERSLPGLEPELLVAVVARLLDLEPAAAAVVVTGSYAKGTADERSDLDVRAITTDPPRVRYRTWFAERGNGVPLHVSAGAKSVDDWLAARAEPSEWALGFPAQYEAAYLWATDRVRAALRDPPSHRHPPADAELEDFVEALVKVRRAAAQGDAIGARWHAQSAGRLAPRLLLGLNEERLVHDRREALAAALALPVAPAGWPDDLAVCLGLVAATDEEAAATALRLGAALLAFVRERDPDVDPQPGVAEALRDGSFERQLEA